MEQRGLRTGHLVALAGAAGAFATLWAPWYTANLAAVMQAVSPQADRVLSPSLAQQFHAAAALLPSSVSVDAWEIFHRNDILIAVMAGLVALVVIAAAGALGDGVRVSPSASGRTCATLGGLCAVLVAIQLVSDPVSNTQVPSSAIHLQWGAYACLASRRSNARRRADGALEPGGRAQRIGRRMGGARRARLRRGRPYRNLDRTARPQRRTLNVAVAGLLAAGAWSASSVSFAL